MHLILNGQSREFPSLPDPATIADLITTLALAPDRVALEQNGEIVPRATWPQAPLTPGDRIEVVHFVGGGSPIP